MVSKKIINNAADESIRLVPNSKIMPFHMKTMGQSKSSTRANGSFGMILSNVFYSKLPHAHNILEGSSSKIRSEEGHYVRGGGGVIFLERAAK